MRQYKALCFEPSLVQTLLGASRYPVYCPTGLLGSSTVGV